MRFPLFVVRDVERRISIIGLSVVEVDLPVVDPVPVAPVEAADEMVGVAVAVAPVIEVPLVGFAEVPALRVVPPDDPGVEALLVEAPLVGFAVVPALRVVPPDDPGVEALLVEAPLVGFAVVPALRVVPPDDPVLEALLVEAPLVDFAVVPALRVVPPVAPAVLPVGFAVVPFEPVPVSGVEEPLVDLAVLPVLRVVPPDAPVVKVLLVGLAVVDAPLAVAPVLDAIVVPAAIDC